MKKCVRAFTFQKIIDIIGFKTHQARFTKLYKRESDMKIALIMVKGNVYGFKNRSFLFRHMPDSLTLGLLYGIIKKNFPDIEIEFYDETTETVKPEKIKADLIGISAITPCVKRAYEYAKIFRSKNIPVFLGGVHATLLPQEAEEHFDSVICGLADDALVELINDFIQSGTIKKRYTQKPDMSFENMAFPQRNIYEEKNFLATELNMVHATYGCPNVCEFCVQPYVCNGYHQRPVDDVIEEIKLIEDEYVEFVDPNLGKDTNYLKELCSKIEPLKKHWFAPMTISVCKDEELLSMLQNSGCCEILIGFESVNQGSVKNINKGFNKVEDYKECVKKLHSYGIKVTGSFVLGLDSDDENVFKDTLDFITDAHIDYVRFTINTPYPGTKYYQKMKEEDRIIEDDWNLYDCQNCVIKPAKMMPQVVEAGHKWLWRNAYSFKNVVKRLSYIDSPIERLIMILKNYIFGKVYTKMTLKDKEFIKNIKIS